MEQKVRFSYSCIRFGKFFDLVKKIENFNDLICLFCFKKRIQEKIFYTYEIFLNCDDKKIVSFRFLTKDDFNRIFENTLPSINLRSKGQKGQNDQVDLIASVQRSIRSRLLSSIESNLLTFNLDLVKPNVTQRRLM